MEISCHVHSHLCLKLFQKTLDSTCHIYYCRKHFYVIQVYNLLGNQLTSSGSVKPSFGFRSGPSLLLLLLDLSRLISIYRYMHGTLVMSSRSINHRSFFQEETFPFKDEVQYYIYIQSMLQWESTSQKSFSSNGLQVLIEYIYIYILRD